MTTLTNDQPILGVVVVTYASADVIATCLETLLGARDVRLRVVVVDNGSPDATLDAIDDWATGQTEVTQKLPFDAPSVPKPIPLDGSGAGHQITVIATGHNGGFAAGVNIGLAHLALDPQIDRFWVLNPDCATPPETPKIFASQEDTFSLMGGRIVFLDDPDKIQIDGGRIQWATGLTKNVGYAQDPASTSAPDPATLDFISGASMVVSRAFYESIGPMREDYFLYYEEVDWAMRRDRPLAYAKGAVVYHKGGASIGSRTTRQKASLTSLFYLNRARLRFLWTFWKPGLFGATAYSLAKACHLVVSGDSAGALVLLKGSFQRPPPMP